jgi:hypothetical protein
MASPFAKYQSEQVQQMAPGFVEAYGRAGASIGQGIATAGAAINQGLAEADKRKKEEIATKASLAPYIRNDDRITATEGMIKSGLLTKADDGTVVVSAKWANYADTKGLKKYLDFYNETGGDGSKLSGDKLVEFASRFEGEQKYISQNAANAKAKTEEELKQAQIAKLRAEAAAKANETGLVTQLLSGMGVAGSGGSIIPYTNESPTAGINITPYTQPTGTGITSVETLTTTPTAVTKVDTTVPAVAAPPAAPVSAALTAGTAPTVAAAAATAAPAAEPAVSAALTAGTAGTPAPAAAAPTREQRLASLIAKAAAAEKVAPFPERVKDGETSEDYDAWVAASNEWTKNYGDTHIPTGSPKTARRVELDFNAANPIEKAAPASAAAPAEAPPEPATAPVGTEEATAAAKVYDVPAESARVTEKLAAISVERESVRSKYASIRTKNAVARSNQRQQALGLSVVSPAKGTGFTSYLDNIKKFEDEAEARELKAIDDKESTITKNFANYQAAATAQKEGRAEDRANRAEQRAINASSATVTKDATKANADIRAAKRQRLLDYPMYSIWNHLGSNMAIDPKTGQQYDPVEFGIKSLSPSAQIAVNEAHEGWSKTVDFMVNMDKTLAARVKDNDRWLGSFRATAKNMQNYFEGELSSVFGVATFRRGIVSGGNFSDADREFVKSAITYLNSAAPDLSAEDLKASLNALGVFVNNMYIRTLEANDMMYDPKNAKAFADKLEGAGMPEKAAAAREGVTRAGVFYSRFGIKPPGGSTKSSYDSTAAKDAFELLYPKLKAKGLLPDGMKIK